jgi:hypothetical protein
MMMYQTCFALGRPESTAATGFAFVAAVATGENVDTPSIKDAATTAISDARVARFIALKVRERDFMMVVMS